MFPGLCEMNGLFHASIFHRNECGFYVCRVAELLQISNLEERDRSQSLSSSTMSSLEKTKQRATRIKVPVLVQLRLFVGLLLSVLLVKTHAFNYRFTFFCELLVVDRPCPVLARQCRKKNVFLCGSECCSHIRRAVADGFYWTLQH